MDLFSRTQPLERVADAAEASAPGMDRALGRARPLQPEPRLAVAPGDQGAQRTAIVLAASLAAHGFAAAALAALPAASNLLATPPTIEIEMALAMPVPVAPPEPEIVPEPVRAEAARPEEPVRLARERPAPERPTTRIEPRAVPASGPLPPSLEEAFAEPAAPPDALVGEAGAFGIAGAAGGREGGVPGGMGDRLQASGATAAATGPSAGDIRRARRSYSDAVRTLLESRARYPLAARVQRVQGRVLLALRIREDGRLIGVRVVGSSGYLVLDDAAIAAANDVHTFPRPPSLVLWDSTEEVRIPLVYEIVR